MQLLLPLLPLWALLVQTVMQQCKPILYVAVVDHALGLFNLGEDDITAEVEVTTISEVTDHGFSLVEDPLHVDVLVALTVGVTLAVTVVVVM